LRKGYQNRNSELSATAIRAGSIAYGVPLPTIDETSAARAQELEYHVTFEYHDRRVSVTVDEKYLEHQAMLGLERVLDRQASLYGPESDIGVIAAEFNSYMNKCVVGERNIDSEDDISLRELFETEQTLDGKIAAIVVSLKPWRCIFE
jgi:hypothetical protein